MVSFYSIETGEELEQGPAKMSKSLKNVVNPDDVVKNYGADAFRLYEMFMGPLDASIAWSEEGLDGARKFLDRVWRLYTNEDGSLSDKIVSTNDGKLDKVYNETVKLVTDHLQSMKFNTAISQMMIFVNAANKADQLYDQYAKGFVQLLAPTVPHIAEELWQKLGEDGGISYVAWPTYDESKLVENEVEIVLQVNGKVKTKAVVPKDMTREQLEEFALSNDEIKGNIEGKTVRKVIAVPGKLVNVVAN